MNRKTIITTAAVTVLGAGILTASTAFAQSTSAPAQNHMDSLVQKIADKFSLNKDEVQAVFDEAHEEHHVQMKAEVEERLSTYVKEGKITEKQKQLILQKHEELKAEREANKDEFKNLSPEEMHTRMEAKHAELEAWAKQNGIDMQYVMPKIIKIRTIGGPEDFGQGKQVYKSTATPTTTQ